MSPIINIPSYSVELFLDREEPTDLVEMTLKRVVQRDKSALRTIIFEAERGSGKTWLALHLVRKVIPQYPQMTPLFICLRPNKDHNVPQENELFLDEFMAPAKADEDRQVADVTARVMRWVAEKVGALRAERYELRELSRWIIEAVETSPGGFALVLDSAYEANWPLLGDLEKYLFGPLAALPNVMTILTGRGRRYPWESPDLKLNAAARQLERFPVNKARQMISMQAHKDLSDSEVEALMDITGGSLLAMIIVAQSEGQAEAINTAINNLLMVSTREDRNLRDYFEALSPLDQFREEQFKSMLVKYYQARNETGKLNRVRDWDMQQIRKERDKLLATNLVRWKEGGYTLDKAVQHLVQTYMATGQPETWEALNREAYQMYSGWADAYPDYQEYYQQQAQTFLERFAPKATAQHQGAPEKG